MLNNFRQYQYGDKVRINDRYPLDLEVPVRIGDEGYVADVLCDSMPTDKVQRFSYLIEFAHLPVKFWFMDAQLDAVDVKH